MLRRKPTRIELKHEDIQEYEELKKRLEAEQTKQQPRSLNIAKTNPKTRAERIGHQKKQGQ